MVVKIAGAGAVVITLLILYFIFRGDTERVAAESKYDGVHLCSPSQREAERIAGGPSPAPTPTVTSTPSPTPTSTSADSQQPAASSSPSASAEGPQLAG